jgi:hypothetical protein
MRPLEMAVEGIDNLYHSGFVTVVLQCVEQKPGSSVWKKSERRGGYAFFFFFFLRNLVIKGRKEIKQELASVVSRVKEGSCLVRLISFFLSRMKESFKYVLQAM